MTSIHKKTSIYDAVFISPHLDDAVLSAGLEIASLVKNKQTVLVITVFCRGSQAKSKDSQHFLSNSRATSADILFQRRRQEDTTAMQILGAKSLHLSYIDALFRKDSDQHLYPAFGDVFSGKVLHKDAALIDTLRAELHDLLENHTNKITKLYAPLGVGLHIDHIITHEVCQRLADRWSFWEDIPYQAEAAQTIKRLAELSWAGNNYTKETTFRPELAQLKKRAVSAYVSQIVGLEANGMCTTHYSMELLYSAIKI
ncbi:MAG: PIG-L family deacetylase [bacterium]|nr:PIG-L family deacetylase [bacterium]